MRSSQRVCDCVYWFPQVDLQRWYPLPQESPSLLRASFTFHSLRLLLSIPPLFHPSPSHPSLSVFLSLKFMIPFFQSSFQISILFYPPTPSCSLGLICFLNPSTIFLPILPSSVATPPLPQRLKPSLHLSALSSFIHLKPQLMMNETNLPWAQTGARSVG